MKKPVIIFGAQALGRVALDIFQQNEVVVYGFLDDDAGLVGKEVDDVSVLGNTTAEQFVDMLGEDCDPFIALENRAASATLVADLKRDRKLVPTNAIHPAAVLASSAMFGHGNLLGAHVVLSAGVVLGNNCLLHGQVVVEQEAVIKDRVHIGSGSIVGAGATLHEGVFVGAGATIVGGVEVGAGASIGAGSVVLANVGAGETVLGNPAAVVKRG